MAAVTPEALETFRSNLQEKLRAHDRETFTKLPQESLEKFLTVLQVSIGRKYAKIARTDGVRPGASVYAFIDMATGNILKPADWRRPAKHARGNIYSEEPLACCGPYGVAYLR